MIDEKPKFADEEIDLIYMGPMSEKWQPVIIEKLKPYKERIRELIEAEKGFLVINTAYEIFGSHIAASSGDLETLGLFDFYAVQDMSKRFNQKMLLKLGEDYVIGTKSQFSNIHGVEERDAWMEVVNGTGNKPGDNFDGYRYKNFYASHVLGPIMLSSPAVTKLIYRLTGSGEEPLYMDIIDASHQNRLKYNLK